MIFEINHRKLETELLISEITEIVIAYTVPHTQQNKMSCLFVSLHIHLSNIIYYSNTGSDEITGTYWPHKTTLFDNKTSPHICHQWHSIFCKVPYQTLGAPRPLTRIQPTNSSSAVVLISLHSNFDQNTTYQFVFGSGPH